MARPHSAQASVVTADAAFEVDVCRDSTVSVVKETDSPEVVETVESSV